jgi:hypothetical protein
MSKVSRRDLFKAAAGMGPALTVVDGKVVYDTGIA